VTAEVLETAETAEALETAAVTIMMAVLTIKAVAMLVMTMVAAAVMALIEAAVTERVAVVYRRGHWFISNISDVWYKTMRLLYVAILGRSLNPADISVHISAIHLFFINHHQSPFPSSTIHLPCLSTCPIFLLKMLLLLLLPSRLPGGLVKRENVGRQRNNGSGKRQNGFIRRRQ
jgi:hypothetical protein